MRLAAVPERHPLVELVQARALRMVAVLLLLWLGLALSPETRDAFLSSGNFSNLTAQIAEIVILGVGMTLVILIGGIDLSVGAGMALTGVICAKLQLELHQSALIACLASLAVLGLVGLWHGILITRFRIPAFIATLSGFLAYRGLGLVLSNARGLSPMGEDFQKLGARLPPSWSFALVGVALVLGAASVIRRRRRRAALALAVEPIALLSARLGAMALAAGFFAFIYQAGMPVPVAVASVALAFGAVLLRRTRLGRYAFAIGGNSEAARLSGVPVEKTTIAIYVLCGLLTALAGIVATARTNGVTPGNAGLMRELHVITAVVIGGTSLSGGRGSMLGTLIGALIFGTLGNGMNLMNVNSNWQLIFTGAILLIASLLDSLSHEKRS